MGKNVKYGMACVVINKKDQILLLKRASGKELFPDKWFVVAAGPLSAKDNMRLIALREIKDELGTEGQILKEGEVFKILLGGEEWRIATFLAKLETNRIKLNEEHTESRWIFPQEIDNYSTVPNTKQLIDSILQRK